MGAGLATIRRAIERGARVGALGAGGAAAAFALWLWMQPDEYRLQLVRGLFQNWERRVQCRPRVFLQPSSVAEVQRIVADAARTGRKVKVVGAGHSWNDSMTTDDTMVNIDKLSRVLEVDTTNHTATVEAGVRLGPLQDTLAEHGLSFSGLPSVNEQSAAGAIATATHGNGPKVQCMSHFVLAAELVDGEGNLVTVSATENADMLPAVQCNLGALGIVVRLKFQLEPLFNLKHTETPVPIDEAVDRLDEYVKDNDYFKMWWSPAAETAQVYCYNRTTAPIDNWKSHAATRWFLYSFLQQHVNNFIMWVSNALLSQDTVNRINAALWHVGFKQRSRVDRSDRHMNVPIKLRHKEIELILPAERGKDVLRAMPDMFRRIGTMSDMAVEVRHVAADGVWLSPSYGRDTVHFTVTRYAGDPSLLFASFEDLCRPMGSRPHWGKWFTNGVAEMRRLYPKFDEWLAVRRRLDPRGVFENDYTHRYLGPVDADPAAGRGGDRSYDPTSDLRARY